MKKLRNEDWLFVKNKENAKVTMVLIVREYKMKYLNQEKFVSNRSGK